jgi:hypothetical protein
MANTCPDFRRRHFETEPLTPSPNFNISSIPPALATRDQASSSNVFISSSVECPLRSGGAGASDVPGSIITGMTGATGGDGSFGGEGSSGGLRDSLSSRGIVPRRRAFVGGRKDGDEGAFDMIATKRGVRGVDKDLEEFI